MTEATPMLTPEQAVAAGVQSPNWEHWNSHEFALDEVAPWEEEGEPMPLSRTNPDGTAKRYDLITFRGERLVGFRFEASRSASQRSGLWVVEIGQRGTRKFIHYYDRSTIIAWRERNPEPQAGGMQN